MDVIVSVMWNRSILGTVEKGVFSFVVTVLCWVFLSKKHIMITTTSDAWRREKNVVLANAFFSIAPTFIFCQVSIDMGIEDVPLKDCFINSFREHY